MHEHLKRLIARDAESEPSSNEALTRRYQELIAVIGLDPWEGFLNAAEISPYAVHGLARSKFHILAPPSATKTGRYSVVDSVAISVYCITASVFLILGGVHLWHKKLSSFAVDITFWVILFSVLFAAMVQISVRRSSSDWSMEWVSCASVNGLQNLVAEVDTGAFFVNELTAIVEVPSATLELICQNVKCSRHRNEGVSVASGEVTFGNAVVRLDAGDLSHVESWLNRALNVYFWPYVPPPSSLPSSSSSPSSSSPPPSPPPFDNDDDDDEDGGP
jgi:hypothetical protein